MGEDGKLVLFKFVGILIFAFSTIAGGFIHTILQRRKYERILAVATAIAAGAFTGLGIFHVIPEAVELLHEEELFILIQDKPYNSAYIFIFVGIVITLGCENLISCSGNYVHFHGSASKESSSCGRSRALSLLQDSASTRAKLENEGETQKDFMALTKSESVEVGIEVKNRGEKSTPNSTQERLGFFDIEEEGQTQSAENYDPTGARQPTIILTSACKEPQNSCLFGITTTTLSLILGFTLHSAFEGMVVGTSTHASTVISSSLIIAAHKWAEAFGIASVLHEQGSSPKKMWIIIILFSMASPLGILIGMIANSNGPRAAGICNAISAGTILFVAFEMCHETFAMKTHMVKKFVAYNIGGWMVFGLTLLEKLA